MQNDFLITNNSADAQKLTQSTSNHLNELMQFRKSKNEMCELRIELTNGLISRKLINIVLNLPKKYKYHAHPYIVQHSIIGHAFDTEVGNYAVVFRIIFFSRIMLLVIIYLGGRSKR